MAKRNRDIKQNLLARKEELLKELKYYEKRIDEVRKKAISHFHGESSDSEQELTVNLEPSIADLKLKKSMLQTRLCATQELTGIQIIQSEVNVVSEPVFERDPPTKEEGIWREVTVECRIDLVQFSMNFYVHQPKCLFKPFLYKNLQVDLVKSAHEQELAISVLSTVETPSDAVEVLRNYAKAHRSRRSTLAKLAETYGHTLFMEPLPEGGYILKCADVLEVSWTLQNKWSPIAPFHHKMKFDLEYMDESYIKIITQLHRQLSDPSVETDERTLLISKIINKCLQAKNQTNITKNDSNIDNNIDKNKDINDKDSEIMAPPKLIPKKNKKRVTDDNGNAKRAKVDNDKENSSNNNNGVDNISSNFDDNSTTSKQIDKNKAKVNENKSKPISNYNNKEKCNTHLSKEKLDKNEHLKTNELKKKENKRKTDKKEFVNTKNKEINYKVTLKSDLKSVDNESTNKQIDKNNQPTANEQNIDKTTKTDKKEQLIKNNKGKNNHQKTNEQNIDEITKTKNNNEKNYEPRTNEQNINDKAKKELLNKKNKEKDNLTSNSNSDIKSNNKMPTKSIDKNKIDLKGKKTKLDERKSRTDNKETLNADRERNKANLRLNEEVNKKNKIDSKIVENNSKNKNNTEKSNTISVTDLKSKTNVIANNEINKNKINTHKNKPKTIISNENQYKIQTKFSKDLKTKNNIIQNKVINIKKIGNKAKISGKTFEIDRNKKKQTNLTNYSNLSNKERNKIISKIPKRKQ